MRLRALAAPFIVCVIYDDAVAAAARTVERGEQDGADAFELNLPRLGYPPAADLVPIFRATTRPIFTSCRRAPFTDVYGPGAHRPRTMPEDERMQRQIDALEHGSAGIDMELDTFDPHPAPPPGDPEIIERARRREAPAEVTENPEAVVRQRAIIERAHAASGDVIMSCHAARTLTADDAVRLGRLMQARGADLAKIVSVTPDERDALDLLRAHAEVRAAVTVPFTLMGVGAAARAARFVAALYGSAWAFGQVDRPAGGFDLMPLVRDLRAVFDAVADRGPAADGRGP